jgi:hypothetical protein
MLRSRATRPLAGHLPSSIASSMNRWKAVAESRPGRLLLVGEDRGHDLEHLTAADAPLPRGTISREGFSSSVRLN